MAAPDPTLAPTFPGAFTLLDEIIRSDLDPDGVLEAWAGGEEGATPALQVSGWTPTRIDGLEGVANYLLWLAWMVRSGTQIDPDQVAPSLLDSLVRGRGGPQDLIDAVRGNASTGVLADRWLRKIALLLPQLLRWKGTRSGGGALADLAVGGIQGALRVLSGHRAPIREVFAWQRWLVDPALPVPADHLIGVSAIPSSVDDYRFDLYVVDWPVGDFLVRSAAEEIVRLTNPAERVYLHYARWVDEFLDDDTGDREWTGSLLGADALTTTPPDPQTIAPYGNPLLPGGVMRLAADATAGTRYLYPRTGDEAVHGSGCLALDHFVDWIVRASIVAATAEVILDVCWDPSTDGGYRVIVDDTGQVRLYADTAAVPTTLRASATIPAFAPGAMAVTGIRITVSVLPVGGGANDVRVYVDDALVITWSDAAPVVSSPGSVRIGHRVPDQVMDSRWFLWLGNPQAPTIIEP